MFFSFDHVSSIFSSCAVMLLVVDSKKCSMPVMSALENRYLKLVFCTGQDVQVKLTIFAEIRK